MSKGFSRFLAFVLAAAISFLPASPVFANPNYGYGNTATPIKHVVVIFQENVSFDHYFATYPNAENPEGELKFKAKNATPAVDGLSQGLLEHNPNSIQPFRLDVSQNYTCSQDHDYMPEQQAFDSGLMDKFPEFTGASCGTAYPDVQSLGTGVVMGY